MSNIVKKIYLLLVRRQTAIFGPEDKRLYISRASRKHDVMTSLDGGVYSETKRLFEFGIERTRHHSSYFLSIGNWRAIYSKYSKKPINVEYMNNLAKRLSSDQQKKEMYQRIQR